MQGFWQGRRVLVTGHTGFKGSWLSIWLHRMGSVVRGIALPPATSPSLFDRARLAEDMDHVVADVGDLDAMRKHIGGFAPEIVLHLAAQALVRPSYEDPVGTMRTNVMGTAHVLEAVRHTPSVRAVVVVTSDKCYENREWVWGYRENEAMGGHDPYSASKGCAELVTAAFRRSFLGGKVAVATARAGNVIGGGDWAQDRLIPDAMTAFTGKRRVVIRNPASIRPWQHVLESLSGYLTLAERLYKDGETFADGWNFGPSAKDSRSVREVIDTVVSLWGDGAGWELAQGAQPHEARTLRLDCAKAQALLGWQPRTGLDAALRWTVRWYQDFARGADAREITLRDIAEFETLFETRKA